MKLISNEEYTKLKGFEKELQNGKFTEDEKIMELKNSYLKQINELGKEHEKEINNLKKDQEIVMRRKDAELDVTISLKTKELTTKLATITAENVGFKKETEMLTTAFKNLGFDVKDMKDILNKLVDGIVGKNKIQLIK